MFEHVVNRSPILNQPLSAKYVKSFAYPTFKERIPKIIDSVIECLNINYVKEKCEDEAVIQEVEIIKQKILNLRNSMVSDGDLLPFNLNSGIFAQITSVYNKMIEQLKKSNNGSSPTWFQTEWLFAECYLYYRLHEIFYTSNTFKHYDPFLAVKIDSLLASNDAVYTLAGLLVETKEKTVPTGSKLEELFKFYLKCSLWGNKSDLSLSNGKAVGAEDTFSTFNEMDSEILVNDSRIAYDVLKKKDNTIDIILDNAGYELFNDLVFADFLIWSGIAKTVVFHGKNIPWFVSDVTPTDFKIIFDLLETKLKNENTLTLVNSWREYLDEGVWELKCEPFWTYPCDFSKMSSEAPELYKKLGLSDLLIFKGDLNYRKLMGDIFWEPTTSFKFALRGFEPTNVLALRTVKADTISGLPKGVFEELNAKEANWMITGKYALIQLLRK
ncbi:hypothetical protein V9T40_004166 [Parthenolecanium corni]|uniref:Sugar phosphate phosphatase n=1 Tax=Parthenolecanium corni TaxID=536013 RepID=A0AAN9U342_9HEMI